MAEIKKSGNSVTKTKTSVVKEVEKPVAKQTKTKKIPLDYVVTVRSGVQGLLVYVSRKNGYEVIWDNYGAIENLEYGELVAMRNGHKRFFVDNWVFFEDTEEFTAEEIYKQLMVDKYYTDILEINDIDAVIALSPEKFREKVKNIPNGVKDAIITRAKQLMIEGSDIMDSNKKIQVIEETLDVELIPKDI